MTAQPNNYQCDINMKASENAKATYIWHAHTHAHIHICTHVHNHRIHWVQTFQFCGKGRSNP